MYLKDKDSTLIVRISQDNANKLHNLADSVDMSFSDYMRFVIARHLLNFQSADSVRLPCLCDYDFFKAFVNSVIRSEYFDNPIIYKKAIRATLIALGYNEDFINGEFRHNFDLFLKGVEDDKTTD